MLYYHFGSKRALYVEVLRDMFRAVGARARAIADGPGTAPEKLDTWIATIVAEAALRPWFPPMMLRELASGAPRFDPETFAMMNAVYGAVRDVIVQGQQEGAFRDADPLLTHMTIMPPILIFFARQRVLAHKTLTDGLAAPRDLDDFVRHMQAAARGMLRKDV
jgi:AcrR family transcriptional regulator